MINEIIDGISIAINAEFGDNHEIYTESMGQGLKEPCFSIICLNPIVEQFLGKRYFRANQFCIHYFPASKERQFECNEVIEKLYGVLEYITVAGDIIRGTDMHCEVVDGVLSFFVNYDMFVYSNTVKEESMETFEHNTNLKG